MSAVIEKMRADWRVVAEDKRQRGEWSEADEKEVGDLVKAAVASNDESLVTCWARWLGELAGAILLLRLVARGTDANIKRALAEDKAAKASKGA